MWIQANYRIQLQLLTPIFPQHNSCFYPKPHEENRLRLKATTRNSTTQAPTSLVTWPAGHPEPWGHASDVLYQHIPQRTHSSQKLCMHVLLTLRLQGKVAKGGREGRAVRKMIWEETDRKSIPPLDGESFVVPILFRALHVDIGVHPGLGHNPWPPDRLSYLLRQIGGRGEDKGPLLGHLPLSRALTPMIPPQARPARLEVVKAQCLHTKRMQSSMPDRD